MRCKRKKIGFSVTPRKKSLGYVDYYQDLAATPPFSQLTDNSVKNLELKMPV